jgi:histidyl-tRNA synthetase
MLRGTRIIEGIDATALRQLGNTLLDRARARGVMEVQVPAIWEQAPFIAKGGPEIVANLYAFQDRGGRDICLIPEVTAILSERFDQQWSRNLPKPVRVCYVSRCYRYDRPQAGRYREFTQFGVEIFGGRSPEDWMECRSMIEDMLQALGLTLPITTGVKRGLGYYVEDGFEVRDPRLGAQQQLLGGGRYNNGIGFAFGLERLLAAMEP